MVADMTSRMVVTVIASLIAIGYSAPSNVPRASNVRVQLLDFSYTGNCDPFGISKCDLKFKVDYLWNGKSRTVTYGEYDGGNSAHVDFSKEAPQNLDGPFAPGSKVVINVLAIDVDLIIDDVLGRFRFEYTVPSHPTPHTVLTLREGKATMTIDFDVSF